MDVCNLEENSGSEDECAGEENVDVNVLKGKVGDCDVEFVLDSGARISVVPEEVVPLAQRLQEFVTLKVADEEHWFTLPQAFLL